MNKVAIKISFWYFLISLLWIFFSDYLLHFIIDYKFALFLGGMIKGISYIAVTSVVLYLLISNYNNKLFENKKQYERLFEENPNSMWIYDLETLQILAVNHAALITYGYSRNDFLQLNLTHLRPNGEIQKLMEDVKVIPDTYSNSGIWLHKKKNGELFYVNIHSHSTQFNNKNARLILALDVNDKYIAEQQIRLQNIKLKEIAHIQSHHIRRPVASILGLVNLFDKNNINNAFNGTIIEKMGITCRELDEIIHTVVDKTYALEIENSKE